MNIPPGIDRRENSNGTVTYRVRIRIKGHKPVSKTFKTLTHAKQWQRVTEAQIEKGVYLSYSEGEQYTLSDAIARYEKEVLPTKVKDQKNVQRHLNRWKIELGHLKLNRLTPTEIASIRDRLLSEKIKGEKDRSNGTVARYMASLSHVLSIATKEWQWIQENPCYKVKKPKESPGRVRYLSKDELMRLLQACKQSKNTDLYLIVLIALTTGARKSEILELKWANVDFENKLLYLEDTKNGEDRSLPITDQVYQMLKERAALKGLVFASRKDPNKSYCIRSAWELALKKAEIINFRFHDIRHTTASYLAMNGSTTGEIAEMLGHKTLQMTKRYSHFSHEHKRTLVNHIDSLLNQ